MCSFASQTWKMATSILAKPSSEQGLDVTNTQDVSKSKTTLVSSSNPLVIPNATSTDSRKVSDVSMASIAFSAMSLDTIPESQASSYLTTATSEDESDEDLPIYSMAEVEEHRDPSDAWMVIYDRVYDVTSFLEEVISYINTSQANLQFSLFGIS